MFVPRLPAADDDFKVKLKQKGEEGWEVTTTINDDNCIILKREIPEPATSTSVQELWDNSEDPCSPPEPLTKPKTALQKHGLIPPAEPKRDEPDFNDGIRLHLLGD